MLLLAGSAQLSGRRENDNEVSAWLARRGWAILETNGEKETAHPGQWLICSGRQIRQESVLCMLLRIHGIAAMVAFRTFSRNLHPASIQI